MPEELDIETYDTVMKSVALALRNAAEIYNINKTNNDTFLECVAACVNTERQQTLKFWGVPPEPEEE